MTIKPDNKAVEHMCQSLWDKLAEDLRFQDQWGDFDRAQSHPNALKWPEIGDHPVTLVVNGCVSTEHFAEYVPILVQALDELDESAQLGMVASALCRKGLTEATSRLLNQYQDHEQFEDKRFLWSVGNAIYTIAPRD
ncbi:MAG: hypothetical protein KDA93_25160, partial [Planctomycetaceae bacterium]|nr:hypothetical protein [Planctomycetaceae bacterium]